MFERRAEYARLLEMKFLDLRDNKRSEVAQAGEYERERRRLLSLGIPPLFIDL